MFPVIQHINDVLPHIQDAPEISVTVKGDYTVINYQVVMQDTFPDNNEFKSMIRRECRGMIFHTATGQILRRPYHKFFNINERASTHQDNVDLSQKHVILDKLDGSMISPFICEGQLLWGTRAGVTEVSEQSEEFLRNNPNYANLAILLIQNGHTPMFEWCSRKQRIVLDYGQDDRLVLTGIRNTVTGEYWDKFQEDLIAQQHNVETVKSFDNQNNIQDFINHTRGLENTEGYIARFESGLMFKVKCDWYCQLHKTLEHLVHEKDVIRLILDQKLDDAKAILPEDRIKALDNFSDILHKGIQDLSDKVWWNTLELSDKYNGSRKDFAMAVKDMKEKNFMFKALDITISDGTEASAENSLRDYIRAYVRDGASSQTKVNEMRWIWNDYKWEDIG